MKITIEVLDTRGLDLLANCILNGIHELVTTRDTAAQWGCGTMMIQDNIDRLQLMLPQVVDDEIREEK